MARIGTSDVDGESPLLNDANLHLCLYRIQKQIYGMLHLGILVSFVLHACGRKMLVLTARHSDIYMLLLRGLCSSINHLTSSFPAHKVSSASISITMSTVRRSKAMPTDGPTAKFLYTILKQLDLKSVSILSPTKIRTSLY